MDVRYTMVISLECDALTQVAMNMNIDIANYQDVNMFFSLDSFHDHFDIRKYSYIEDPAYTKQFFNDYIRIFVRDSLDDTGLRLFEACKCGRLVDELSRFNMEAKIHTSDPKLDLIHNLRINYRLITNNDIDLIKMKEDIRMASNRCIIQETKSRSGLTELIIYNAIFCNDDCDVNYIMRITTINNLSTGITLLDIKYEDHSKSPLTLNSHHDPINKFLNGVKTYIVENETRFDNSLKFAFNNDPNVVSLFSYFVKYGGLKEFFENYKNKLISNVRISLVSNIMGENIVNIETINDLPIFELEEVIKCTDAKRG